LIRIKNCAGAPREIINMYLSAYLSEEQAKKLAEEYIP